MQSMALTQRGNARLSLAVALVAAIAFIVDVVALADGEHNFSTILGAVAMAGLAVAFSARGLRQLRH
jgi:thiamine transporter ThiT